MINLEQLKILRESLRRGRVLSEEEIQQCLRILDREISIAEDEERRAYIERERKKRA